ncbi:MFS transporter [Cohnella cholangitidis]|uniref:MFS transporter n=1 Tax=Cohnella cholangitidis TaxID=2598458 RepID=A0A7G5BY63_9BACL|nr:MFS transporter [Cohnella cholangitidis]QMV41897.1 MFS transporter [Cohnella cholangitidis]
MRQRYMNSPMMYAFGMLAMMIPSQAFSTFYSYYYVDKLGLGLGLATLARTIFLVWDAVNQPLFGYWSDRTQTKYGRRRPWLFGAIPLFMLTFIMVFSPPSDLSEMGLFTWFLIALVLYEAVATVIWVNYGALFPELFKGDRLRTKASAVQQGFQIVALLIGTALTPLIYDALGFSNMSIIYAIVFALLMLLCLRFIKEDEEARKLPQLGFKKAFKETLKNKTFWLVNIANSFAQTVNGLLSATLPFYAKYVLGIPDDQHTVLLASVFVSVIPLVGVWYWLLRKMDPVRGWRLSFVAYALSVIPLWFGSNLVTGIIAGVLVGFGLAGFLVSPAMVNSSIIDQDFAKTGSRREGIYTAVSGFIVRSSGLISAVAFLIVGAIFGYESGDNPGPDPEATFRYLISAVPLGLLIISIIISLFVRIERKAADES